MEPEKKEVEDFHTFLDSKTIKTTGDVVCPHCNKKHSVVKRTIDLAWPPVTIYNAMAAAEKAFVLYLREYAPNANS